MQSHWGEHAAKQTLHPESKLKVVACCSVFAIFPSFNDFLKFKVLILFERYHLSYLSIFYVLADAETSRRKAGISRFYELETCLQNLFASSAL